jgi:hypothetical protein
MRFRFSGANVDTSKFSALETFEWWLDRLADEIRNINEQIAADDEAIKNLDPRRPQWRKRAKESLLYLRDVRGKLEFERNQWASKNTVKFRKVKTYFHLVARQRLPAETYEALLKEAEEMALADTQNAQEDRY